MSDLDPISEEILDWEEAFLSCRCRFERGVDNTWTRPCNDPLNARIFKGINVSTIINLSWVVLVAFAMP